MRNVIYFAVGFLMFWIAISFIFFTFDYGSLSNHERFGLVAFSAIGGAVGLLISLREI